jgi:hypothetical protein
MASAAAAAAKKSIDGLKHFMLFDDNKQTNDFFIPKDKDKLFWIFYIMKNGIEEYKLIESKNKFSIEKQICVETIEKRIRANPKMFKPYKLSRNMIEMELSSDEKLTLEGFYGLCIAHDINPMVIHNGCIYFEYYTLTSKTQIVEKKGIDSDSDYGIHINPSAKMIETIRDTYWNMESLKKPIRSITAYTLDELEIIYKKLALPMPISSIKLTKKILYEHISEKCKTH